MVDFPFFEKDEESSTGWTFTHNPFSAPVPEDMDKLTEKKDIEKENDLEELFDSGKEILLGTNKYPNPNDKMKHDLELFPFVKTKDKKTLIAPIIEKRLSEKLEQERLALEE